MRSTSPAVIAALLANAVLCASPGARADVCPETLAAIHDRVLERAPAASVVDADLEAARLESRAGAMWLSGAPSIYGTWISDAPTDTEGLREYEGGVALPVRLPAERSALQAAGRAGLEVAQAVAEVHALTQAGALREALWRLAEARVVRDRAEHELEHLGELHALVTARLERGDVAPLDLDLVDMELEAARATLVSATAELAAERRGWQALTGCDATSITTTEPETPANPPASDPRLVLAEADVTRARAQQRAQQARPALAPTVQVLMRRERGEQMAPWIDSVGISVTLPIGQSAEQRNGRAAAARTAGDRTATFASVARSLDVGRDVARSRLDAARTAAEAAGRRAARARTALERAERAHALGEWSTIELLRFEGMRAEAELDEALAQVAVGRATAALNQSLGLTFGAPRAPSPGVPTP